MVSGMRVVMVLGVLIPSATAFQALDPQLLSSVRPSPLLASSSRTGGLRLSTLSMHQSGPKPLKAQHSLVKQPTKESKTALKASTSSGSAPEVNKMVLLGYFAGWYILNVGYNIFVKKTLNVCPLPWTFAVIQLGAGIIWLAPQWLSGIRPIPKPSEENLKALSKVAAFHGAGQLATVTAMGLGSVSFVNVVKALEPLLTALIGLLVTRKNLPWQVWASMVPVCAGVGLASVSELSFTWGCFLCAMFSNIVYASRAVLSKLSMNMDDPGENMDAANTYAVVTMIAFVYTIPFALLLEGSQIGTGLAAVKAAGWTWTKLAQMVGATGLLYYTYNEMAFLVLGSVAPITQSVGNTIKRVVVIVAASLAFRTPMTPLGIAGSSIAILGVLLYSVVKAKYPGEDEPKKIEEEKPKEA